MSRTSGKQASWLLSVMLLGLLLAACSADTPMTHKSSAQAGTSGFENPDAGAASGAETCMTGPVSCYCDDGTQSGSQFCDSRQELTSCMCSGTTTGMQTSMAGNGGSKGDPTRVCSQLAGKTGCDARSYVSPQVPASILFVVDRSGSMACNAPPVQTVQDCEADPKRKDDNAPSRWETTVAALNDAFSGLSQASTAQIGLTFFSTDGMCGADSTPVVGLDAVTPVQLKALSDAMAATLPSGGTPIVGAVILGYHHLHEEVHATGNRYVVLITDGEESCGTKGDEHDTADLKAARDQLLNSEVQKARDANIKTFVIGSPGSDAARGFLSELAFRGGTARDSSCVHGNPEGMDGDCHFDLSKETDFAGVLRKTLGQISGDALGCEFETPSGGSTMINVQYSQNGGAPSCFAQDDSKPCNGGANGWQFAKKPDGSKDLSKVLLCGPACDMVKADPTSVVDVILGCPVLQ